MQQNMHMQPPPRSETKTKQAGPPHVTLWVLLASVLLAAILGAMLLMNTDMYPPSSQRNQVENQPVAGNQPSPPAAQPQTRQ